MIPVKIGRLVDVSEILTMSILKMDAIRVSEAADIQLSYAMP
jgi:hypothetical protein